MQFPEICRLFHLNQKQLLLECIRLQDELDTYKEKFDEDEIEFQPHSIQIEVPSNDEGYLINVLNPHTLCSYIEKQYSEYNIVTVLHPPIKELGLYTLIAIQRANCTKLRQFKFKLWVVPTVNEDN